MAISSKGMPSRRHWLISTIPSGDNQNFLRSLCPCWLAGKSTYANYTTLLFSIIPHWAHPCQDCCCCIVAWSALHVVLYCILKRIAIQYNTQPNAIASSIVLPHTTHEPRRHRTCAVAGVCQLYELLWRYNNETVDHPTCWPWAACHCADCTIGGVLDCAILQAFSRILDKMAFSVV